MPFIGKQSTSNSQITNYTTTVGSGGQTNFTVVIEGGDETHVYLNGVLLKETTDYTVSSTQVSLVSPAVENDIVEIKVFRSFALADAVRASDGGTFSGDVTVPNLTLSSNVIKASDGGSTITLDTSDNVTIGGDLKVTNLKHASSGSNNLVLGSDGSATINQISSSTVFPAGGTGNPISVAVIADEKSNGTVGGASASGGFAQRELNTEISDPDGIVSIASNQFTLGAGTYHISWSAPAYNSNEHQTQLYDITGGTSLEAGSSEYSSTSGAKITSSCGSFVHTITSNNVYEIRHQVSSAQTTNGFGLSCSFGQVNIYTYVIIQKLK